MMNKYVKPIAVTGVNIVIYSSISLASGILVQKFGPRLGFPTDQDFEEAAKAGDFKREIMMLAITLGTGFVISLLATLIAGHLTVKFSEMVFPNTDVEIPTEIDV